MRAWARTIGISDSQRAIHRPASTRTIKNVEIVRVPGGFRPAREVLSAGRADVYGENVHVAYRIAAEVPGATVLEGRFNLVRMSIAAPKQNSSALAIVNDFVASAKREGLIADLIARAGLRGVRPAPWVDASIASARISAFGPQGEVTRCPLTSDGPVPCGTAV